MDYRKCLENLLDKNEGVLLTKNIVEAGISKQLLSKYLKKGYIERVAQGVYLSKDAFEDDMYVLQARSRKAVFSHETALYLHDLTDRDPLQYTVTLPSGYNATKFKDKGVYVHFIKSDLLNLGVEDGKTPFGRTIRIYNKERTICDIIRNRNVIDPAILNEAVRRYLFSKEKNIPKLMQYAEKFRVEKIIRQHVESLK
ncbi:type IV toxin-antitoxin system AbiEi family antitoxin domain-containing protein [Fusibacter tunisiensis]|uniref:Transcriptional regulator of viral defense system n=1 Tax=Fusibacter tunisiensis TaxID=1008308 RepID=A0ABS2MTG9_9FIRM|nr:type IV toxin-antitoxin system AbiEi family antitoxin domain-containing protein [Fusibacter tunisiensis]MBM7562736.1 putative transcriptional regulator of viral defense system [Fusibacter tunisiensis]